MADPWVHLLARHAAIVAKPKRSWTEEETEAVWTSVVEDGVARALYKYFFRHVCDPEVAQEILQNFVAQLSLDRTYDPGDAGAGAFRVWIFGCAHHHLCSFYEGRTKEVERLGQRVEPAPERADRWAAARGIETRLDASTMLSRLPQREREVMRRWIDGESSRDTATALGLTEGHVRQLVFRSLKSLRKQLGISAVHHLAGFENGS
jgi:RNA polymerase sigma factor (sigma-70 family)